MWAAALQRDCLFVYGTLMIASGHPMAARLAGESRVVGPATAPGQLYDFGSYPGAIPCEAASARVHGLVLKLSHPQRALRWLDIYEGCGPGDPEPHGFTRVITAVKLSSGCRLDAWIYYYRGALTDARRVRSGRYGARKPLAPLRS